AFGNSRTVLVAAAGRGSCADTAPGQRFARTTFAVFGRRRHGCCLACSGRAGHSTERGAGWNLIDDSVSEAVGKRKQPHPVARTKRGSAGDADRMTCWPQSTLPNFFSEVSKRGSFSLQSGLQGGAAAGRPGQFPRR